MDLSPEYLGVGYVIGPRIAGVMFAGGVLSWLVLLPLLSYLGNFMTVPLPPVPGKRAANRSDERRRSCGAPTSATRAPAPCSRPG